MSEISDESRKFFGGIYHPYRRYFARLADLFLIGSINLYIVHIIAGHFFYPENPVQELIGSLKTPFTLGVLLYPLMIPIEALCIARFGKTPAKWTFGITVLKENGDKLSIFSSFKRTLMAVILGAALDIKGIKFFTLIFAYYRLTKTGKTNWDRHVGAEVSHTTWDFKRGAASVLHLVFSFIVFAAVMEAITHAYM